MHGDHARPPINMDDAVLRFLVLREFDKGWKDYLADLDLLRSDIF